MILFMVFESVDGLLAGLAIWARGRRPNGCRDVAFGFLVLLAVVNRDDLAVGSHDLARVADVFVAAARAEGQRGYSSWACAKSIFHILRLSYTLSHDPHVVTADFSHVGVAGMSVLLDGDEAVEADLLESRDNRLDVHHAPTERRELSHQAVDIAHVQIHQVPAHFVDRERRVFPLEQSPARVEVVAQIVIANLVPQPQKRSGIRHQAMCVLLDGELQAVSFRPRQAGFGGFHVCVPHPVPIESLCDVDVILLARFGVRDLVVAGQILRRPFQLASPGRHDIDHRRAQLLPDSAARLKIIQSLLAGRWVRARQVLDHRLEQDELRDKQFVPLELLVEPVDPLIGPEVLEVSARRDDQLDAVEAHFSDDVDGRLGVGGGTQIMETPAQAADFRLVRPSTGGLALCVRLRLRCCSRQRQRGCRQRDISKELTAIHNFTVPPSMNKFIDIAFRF